MKTKQNSFEALTKEFQRIKKSRERHNSPEKLAWTILRLHLTLGYYTCVIPFKPTGIQRKGGNVTKSGKILSFCGVWLPGLVQKTIMLLPSFKTFTDSGKFSPGGYFLLVCDIAFFVRIVTFFRIVFWMSEDIQSLLEKLSKSNVSSEKNSWSYLYLLGIYLYAIIVPSLMEVMDERSPFSKIVDKSWEFPHANFFLWIVQVWLEVGNQLVWFITDVILYFPLPISLWNAASSFEGVVEKVKLKIRENQGSGKGDLDAILGAYDDLKYISDKISSLWGMYVIFWICDTSLYIAFRLREMLASSDTVVMIRFLGTMIHMAIALVISAEVTRKMSCFKTWAMECSSWIGDAKWGTLLRELSSSERIGIGLEGFYRINYSFLAQLIIVIITLFTISFDK